MTRSNNRLLLRREFLRRGLVGAVLALGAAAAQSARAAGTSDKMTKKQAGYVDRKKAGPHNCGECISFFEPNSCAIVDGAVSSIATCRYYQPAGS